MSRYARWAAPGAGRSRSGLFLRLGVLAPVAFLVVGSLTALTASNSVPASRAGVDVRTIGPNDLKPANCAALTLNALVTGSGTVSGTNAAELILASSGIDIVSGGNGRDCILGGAGGDTIDGGAGNDVCLGGPDTDVFLNCETQVQ